MCTSTLPIVQVLKFGLPLRDSSSSSLFSATVDPISRFLGQKKNQNLRISDFRFGRKINGKFIFGIFKNFHRFCDQMFVHFFFENQKDSFRQAETHEVYGVPVSHPIIRHCYVRLEERRRTKGAFEAISYQKSKSPKLQKIFSNSQIFKPRFLHE